MMIKVGKRLRSHKPGRTQKVKPASGVRSGSRSSKRRPPFETVRFVYPSMSEWFDYHDIFGQLARKLGGDRVSISGVLPMRGGGAFISECELPRKIASQFKAEFKTYYCMLTQRQKDHMNGRLEKRSWMYVGAAILISIIETVIREKHCSKLDYQGRITKHCIECTIM